ncbi:ribosome recycling factor domain-containing protein [Gongronella butleri]|nr:ribosome recycling factor domain-containing protein [Gongronella butleri]
MAFVSLLGKQLSVSTATQISFGARNYGKKVGKKKMPISETVATEGTQPQFDEQALTNKFGSAVNAFKEQLGTLHIGRANPALLDPIRVPVEGTTFSLRDLAQVTIRDPQTLLVTVHDAEFQKAVDKSIREAGLNLNPVIESKNIRVPIPKPTKESREKLVKLVNGAAEQMKSRIRLVRQEGMKQLKMDAKTEPKDSIKKQEKSVQTMTDKFNKEVDDMLKNKLKELQ